MKNVFTILVFSLPRQVAIDTDKSPYPCIFPKQAHILIQIAYQCTNLHEQCT